MVSGYSFLTLKPLLLVLNVAEEDLLAPIPEEVAAAAEERGLGVVVLSAGVEMDIAQMPEQDQAEFVASLGLEEPARNRFIRAAYELIDLVSMLTVGPDECRAWPVPRGTPAPRGAAGKFTDRHGEDRQRCQHAGTDHGDEARLQRADHAGCFGMR